MRKRYMKFLYAAAVTVLITALLIMLVFIPESDAQSNSSQEYFPSRFAVIAAEVNVMTPDMGGRDATQNILMRVDTATGRTWILQVNVAGGNDPRVRAAVWHETGFRR